MYVHTVCVVQCIAWCNQMQFTNCISKAHEVLRYEVLGACSHKALCANMLEDKFSDYEWLYDPLHFSHCFKLHRIVFQFVNNVQYVYIVAVWIGKLIILILPAHTYTYVHMYTSVCAVVSASLNVYLHIGVCACIGCLCACFGVECYVQAIRSTGPIIELCLAECTIGVSFGTNTPVHLTQVPPHHGWPLVLTTQLGMPLHDPVTSAFPMDL